MIPSTKPHGLTQSGENIESELLFWRAKGFRAERIGIDVLMVVFDESYDGLMIFDEDQYIKVH